MAPPPYERVYTEISFLTKAKTSTRNALNNNQTRKLFNDTEKGLLFFKMLDKPLLSS